MKEKIEKLREKIKAKPKLYKTLHIVKFLCNLLVYGFALFTILSLSIASCDNNNKQALAYEYDKSLQKGAVELNNGGYLYNVLEFVNRFIESPKRVEEFKDLEIDQYIIYNGLYNYMYANQSNMNMGQGNFVIDGVNIGSILGQVKSDGYYWYNATLPERDIDYNFYSSPTPDENNLIFSITVGYIKTSMAQIEQWSYTQVQINELDRTYFVYDSNSAGDVLGLRMSHNGDYQAGYEAGVNAGWSNGYQHGYSVGSTGLDTNPFNLISNAFSGIASFLNIQVLPNLTVGVLIFVPLVVTILIVIVKVFKG